jgi:hypothetical protein
MQRVANSLPPTHHLSHYLSQRENADPARMNAQHWMIASPAPQ